MVGPVLGERQEKLQVRPHIQAVENAPEELDWPFLFEGHTLVREQAGLRCSVCGKGASDIAGRPRWPYFREFRCVPKRCRGRPRRLRDHALAPSLD
eukprot:2870856-Amphidinium_carterae.1